MAASARPDRVLAGRAAASRDRVRQHGQPRPAGQPSWARAVHELGAGPTPIPFPALTAERLAAAIRQAVTDQQMRHRAAELGTRIRAEDGPGRTAELFHSILPA